MKDISDKNKTNITYEVENALRNYIRNEYQKEVLIESNIELIINKKMDKVDKHLSSFIGKIDKSLMNIQATDITLLKKFMEVYTDGKFDEDELLEYMEHKGDKLYKRSLIKAREEKVKNEG
jgi:hypothetical protein